MQLSEEVVKQLFSLTEKIALLSGGLSNVEKSLLKVEDYQSRLVDDNKEANTEITAEVKTVRQAVEELGRVNRDVVDSVNSLSKAISEVKEVKTEEVPCEICAEKDKMVEEKQEAIKDLMKVRKTLALAVVAVTLLLLVALGMNFDAIRQIVGIIK